MDVIKLSATSISLFSQCPYAYVLYKEKVPSVKLPALNRGLAFHKLVAYMLQGDDFEVAFNKVNLELIDVDTNLLKLLYWRYRGDIEQIREQGFLYSELYFELPVTERLVLHGYIDVVMEDKIIEIKTTTLKVNQPRFSHVFQASLYSLVDDLNKKVELHYVSPDFVKKFQIKQLPKDFVLGVVKSVENYILTENYPALGLINGYCKYCLFIDFCEYIKLMDGSKYVEKN